MSGCQLGAPGWGRLVVWTAVLWAVAAAHTHSPPLHVPGGAVRAAVRAPDGVAGVCGSCVGGVGGLRLRGGSATYDSKEAEKFDQALWEIMAQHPDEIHFLNTVFNFLQRRTPCFNGPNALTNYKILIETLTHQRETYKTHIEKGLKMAPHKPMPPRPAAPPAAPRPLSEKKPPPPRPTPPAPAKKEKKPKSEMTEQEKLEDSSASHDEGRSGLAEGGGGGGGGGGGDPYMDARSEFEKKEEARAKARAEGYGQDPVNNGGTTDRYVWTQQLKELTVEIWLPKDTRAKDLKVEARQRQLDVRIKGSDTPILAGELEDEILPDETIWTIEDGVLVLTLSKAGDMTWWKSVIKGDPIINLKKVEPENSNLQDLEPDLRQTVEKMMHDQKMKAMGKPTLEQEKNKDMINKFMKNHPEMDFSQCKFG